MSNIQYVGQIKTDQMMNVTILFLQSLKKWKTNSGKIPSGILADLTSNGLKIDKKNFLKMGNALLAKRIINFSTVIHF